MAELERRLRARGTDSDDVIAGRMARAEAEISHWAEYDYVLINRDVDACLAHIRTILAAERLKRVRQPGLVDFVRGLDTKTGRSEEHTSELQSLMRISYAVFCFKKKTITNLNNEHNQ